MMRKTTIPFFTLSVLFSLCKKAASWNADPVFAAWLQKYNKSYSPVEETVLRQRIFLDNANTVERHNEAYEAGYTTYRMTVFSPFSDLTNDEFTDLHLMESQNCSATTTTTQRRLRPKDDDDDDSPVLSIDWRTKGIITPIKNQGPCGSCWTFSTTGCLEAHLCLAHKKDCTTWTGLAEQQLVDCAGAFNNFGCNGGLPSQAFEYIKYSKEGLAFEELYAYNASDGACRSTQQYDHDDDHHHHHHDDKDHHHHAHVAEVFNITSRDEDDLVYAVANVGPVSIAYQVSPDFRFYAHGVYDSFNATTNSTMCQSEPQNVNHAVVAVGLGTTATDDVPYYIVRNSWGTSWGMEGYFWMKRGDNLCGVSDCASFPLVPTPQAVLLRRGDQTVKVL